MTDFPNDLLHAQVDYVSADRALAEAVRGLPTFAADYPPGAAEQVEELREAMRTAGERVNTHPFWASIEQEKLVATRSELKQAAKRQLGIET